MKYRHPYKIKQPISIVGFGAWQLGNTEFFGPMSDQEAIQLVQDAVNRGINLFDTAPGYGSGNSERLLGIALQSQRKNVFINTKFGHTADGRSDFSVEALEPAVHDSLQRLQTTYIDGVILHNPGNDMLYGTHPIYDELKRLKKTGLIRYYGVSIDSKAELEIVLHHNDVDIIELLFNIIHQEAIPYFEDIKQKGIMLLTKVPLDSGWLSGKYTAETKFTGIRSRWTTDVIATRLAIIKQIKEILGKSLIAQESLQFIQSFDAVTSVIPGTRNLLQLKSNVESQEHTLSQAKKEALQELYQSTIQYQHTPW